MERDTRSMRIVGFRQLLSFLRPFYLKLLDKLVIILSSFVIFASILVDTFSSSFMRLLRLRDDAFDFNGASTKIDKKHKR